MALSSCLVISGDGAGICSPAFLQLSLAATPTAPPLRRPLQPFRPDPVDYARTGLGIEQFLNAFYGYSTCLLKESCPYSFFTAQRSGVALHRLFPDLGKPAFPDNKGFLPSQVFSNFEEPFSILHSFYISSEHLCSGS